MFLFGNASTHKKTSHFQTLSQRWTVRHETLTTKFWQKHAKALSQFGKKSRNLAVGSLAGIVMFTSPGISTSSTLPIVQEKPFKDLDVSTSFLLDLQSSIPKEIRPLTQSEEQKTASILSKYFNLTITPELQGKRLNRSYGYIGQEQHLALYPGDSIDSHFPDTASSQKYGEYGMAPGLGAWGYFAKSQASLANQDVQREKYYVAVQTFLAPGYMEHVREYNTFFKYRKMLIVNPDNGKALVADIADAGPSEWTGKSLGGSPEVMSYLERVDGAQKGAVLYFFIDDPGDKVSLGPISERI